ncbi:unnamed protein product [Adineta steineri]|uniref:Uncharacterized protein n=1 Tax=Adineta steineri TaxID=433720 RepID=A0A815UEP9_9BILA|nr:unnamed protein product [Adineta steineri]CAF1512953.1 unnamed protein product [Adineta steineri]
MSKSTTTTTSTASILIPPDECFQLVKNTASDTTATKNKNKVVLTPTMRKVVAQRKLIQKQYQLATTSSSTTAASATEAFNSSGGRQKKNEKNKKPKRNGFGQAATNPVAEIPTSNRQCTMSVVCISAMRSGVSVPLPSIGVISVTPSVSIPRIPRLSGRSTTPNPRSPAQSGKRKHSTSPTYIKEPTHFTRTWVNNRETFSIQVENILNAASFSPTRAVEECERRSELTSHLLRWRLEQAAKAAIADLRKILK